MSGSQPQTIPGIIPPPAWLTDMTNGADIAAITAVLPFGSLSPPVVQPPQPPVVPTPTIASIAPASAALASLKPGPTLMTITGTDFVDGTTTVTVKGAPVSSITVTGSTTIAFDVDLSGETAAGAIPVVVSNGAGKTATRDFTIT